MKEQQATEADLKLLNRFTQRELAEDEVFTFSAKFIDSEPTSNGRVWTKEWQEQAVERKLFDGIPFLTNHENDQTMKLGTVYSAEMREDGIYGKVFIPLDDKGKEAKEDIENGRIRNVSINADGATKKEADHLHILPSADMRVYEVSAVAVGGCRSCTITESAECLDHKESSEPTDSLLEFGKAQTDALGEEISKLAGFLLGDVNRDTYRKLAEKLDPFVLQAMVQDFRAAYTEINKVEPPALDDCDGCERDDAIKQAVQTIRKIKGI